MSFIDPSIIKPFNVVLDAGSGMAGMVAPKLFERLPCTPTTLCFEVDGTFPEPRGQPAHRGEPPRHRRARRSRRRRTSASRGTATPTAASSSTARGEFIAGDFVTALLAEAFLLKHPGAKIVYDVRASYAVKDIVAKIRRHVADEPRRATPSSSAGCARTNAIFGGEVTGHYYFRDNFFADNGFIPALLILELMSRKGQTLRELLAPLREKYFISGEINTKVAQHEPGAGEDRRPRGALRRRPRLHARRHLGRVPGLALQRPRRRTPSRCCG